MTTRTRVKYALSAVLVCAGVVVVGVETYVLSPEVRGACVEPLEWAGADDRLAALAADPHREVFEPAMAALVRRGPEAVPALWNRAALPGADGGGWCRPPWPGSARRPGPRPRS